MKSLSPNKLASVSGGGGGITRATDLADVGLATGPPQIYKYEGTISCNGTITADDNPGGAYTYNSDKYYSLNPEDSYGVSLGDRFNAEGWGATPVEVTVWISTDDGTNWTQYQKRAYRVSPTATKVSLLDPSPSTGTMICSLNGVWFAFDDPNVDLETPVADGDVLKYNSTDSEYQPAALATIATSGAYSDLSSPPTGTELRTVLGIGEYADDTAAGTGGLSSGELYYNTTSSSFVLKT